jgi:uncharacterized repeat protein (TIGR03803 family)
MLFVAGIVSRSQAQTYSILYSFTGNADGSGPYSPLLRNSTGDIFGATADGGEWGAGALFKLSSSGKETVLANFSNSPVSGGTPTGNIARDSAGNFYGTTNLGGASQAGSIYKVNKTGGETVLFSFHQYVGQQPIGGLSIDSSANLYGTTTDGGRSSTSPCSDPCGVVFEFTSAGVYTVLHRFDGGQDGKDPQSILLRDSLGNLYGTTLQGGGCALFAQGCGTIFKVGTNGVEKILHPFQGAPDGAGPFGGLIRDPKGNFYGTTTSGGSAASCTYGCGTVFKMDASGNVTILHSFQGGPDDGALPSGPLVLDAGGNLYGVTELGGSSSRNCSALNYGFGCGAVFKLEPNGNETILHAFAGSPSDGSGPLWGLIRDSTGNLYGITEGGGPNDAGTIFKIAP